MSAEVAGFDSVGSSSPGFWVPGSSPAGPQSGAGPRARPAGAAAAAVAARAPSAPAAPAAAAHRHTLYYYTPLIHEAITNFEDKLSADYCYDHLHSVVGIWWASVPKCNCQGCHLWVLQDGVHVREEAGHASQQRHIYHGVYPALRRLRHADAAARRRQ